MTLVESLNDTYKSSNRKVYHRNLIDTAARTIVNSGWQNNLAVRHKPYGASQQTHL